VSIFSSTPLTYDQALREYPNLKEAPQLKIKGVKEEILPYIDYICAIFGYKRTSNHTFTPIPTMKEMMSRRAYEISDDTTEYIISRSLKSPKQARTEEEVTQILASLTCDKYWRLDPPET